MIKMKNLILEGRAFYLSHDKVPYEIQQWVSDMNGGRYNKDYKIEETDTLTISTPGFESDSITYQGFKIFDNNRAQIIPDAEIVRHGWESDSPQGYQDGIRKSGKVNIPPNGVIVAYSSRFRNAIIYISDTGLIKSLSSNNNIDYESEFSLAETIALIAAKKLKSQYRPKFKPEVYQRLMDKGLMKPNKAISTEGKNLVEDPEFKKVAKRRIDQYNDQKGYIAFSSNY